ncbi:MAG TPA: CatB-related O-acetyltransferase [Elusimicrobiales bacterium]|nr:CatB-related O-acetyltransferase [Elusimicrobiales bacterium]
MLTDILLDLKNYLARQFLLSRLRKRHPTCIFYPGAQIDPDSVFGRYNVVFPGAKVYGSSLGDHTFIQRDAAITNADVGKFCSIAPGVGLGLGQHPAGYVSTHPACYSVSQPIARTYGKTDQFDALRRTKVGHDVWIGQNALIMDGVNIGTGAIIAAGAVVTSDVPDYAIAAGIPARILKYRFPEDVRARLLATRWWDNDDAWFEKHFELLTSPERLLDHSEPSGA